MIYDELENLESYRDLASDAISKLTTFCLSLNPDTPFGRYEVDGTKLYAQIRRMNTHAADPDKLEIHREFLDLHLVLEGRETVYYRPVSGLTETRAYNPESDIAFFRSEPEAETALELLPGRFAIFFPGEGHRPDCGPADSEVIKVMIKIHRSYFPCSGCPSRPRSIQKLIESAGQSR